ncbi:DUF2252 domain-containing protein [Herbiconiux sp.]|uniref:DUF2252 domain-containing protein n=1 Tax=Herbiconiux sp. TaxID=1871186 RepID=UPI0025C62D82|nr:DUF2252 domain-containing protein [Herbiconiux sp.]
MPTHLSRLQNDRTQHLSLAEAMAHGRELRAGVPREAHREFSAMAADATSGTAPERDPLGILDTQDATRLPELVPLRRERMLASPFAFYRGTAGIMAADLARGVDTGISVVACGDAHISNFGLFASPQRSLVFDLNDFDESAPAPWEWDLKRLVASVVIGARDAGADEKAVRRAALASAAAYRVGLRDMMKLDALERYYSRIDTDRARTDLDSSAQKVLDRATRQARKRTSRAYVEKITTRADDGTLLIVEDPPVLTHLATSIESEIEELFEQYRSTVPADIALLLSQFTLTDVARRVVGVGSVGTRCFILILEGPSGEPLVLQVKEAQTSVLQSFGAASSPFRYESEGHRVVASQRTLQAVSDSFLGHLQFGGHDFYVRQFRDMKGSIDPSTLREKDFRSYVVACGTVLARAHAQSLDAPVIAGYLGTSRAVDRAVVEWSIDYADVSLSDYEAYRDASRSVSA